MSKRRRGFPSETHVKRGFRTILTPAGEVELCEKLGRNDPCPCGSTRKFKNCCLERLRRLESRRLLAMTTLSEGRTRPEEISSTLGAELKTRWATPAMLLQIDPTKTVGEQWI